MLLDMFELISLGPIPHFILSLVFIAVAWYFYVTWIDTGRNDAFLLGISVISGLISVMFLISAFWHLLEYIDLPFKRTKKDASGKLTQCRVCYQYKPIKKGNVCNDCLPTVIDNM